MNYDDIASTALELLTEFGRVIEHVSVSNGVYSPTTGGVTNTTDIRECMGADFAYKGNAYESELIQTNDRYCLIGNDIDGISVADKLIIDGNTWTVVNVKQLAPAGIPILYKCQIRR